MKYGYKWNSHGVLSLQFILGILSNSMNVQADACTKLSSCKCTYSNGGIINLEPLAKSDGSARFADVTGSVATNTYSWNPCNDFTEETCAKVAMCQKQMDLPPALFNSLGSQRSAKFVTTDGHLAIEYTIEQKGVRRYSYVELTCDKNSGDVFKVKEENHAEGKYYMELVSAHACPSGISRARLDHLSVGTFILIIFGSSIIFLFTIGVLIQKYVRKQSGKDVVPLVNFWIQFPGLVRDGVLFVVHRGRRQGYESA